LLGGWSVEIFTWEGKREPRRNKLILGLKRRGRTWVGKFGGTNHFQRHGCHGRWWWWWWMKLVKEWVLKRKIL
jgi:hypothetical protein